MEVATPAGVWHVRRRWAPRHLGTHTIWARFRHRTRKVRRRTTELGDVPDLGCSIDLAEGVAVVIGAVVVILFMVFIGIPFLIALGELVLILVLALASVVGRVLFRRPWIVDAVDPAGEHHQWSVVGWRASAKARRFIADRIATSGVAPTADEVMFATMSP